MFIPPDILILLEWAETEIGSLHNNDTFKGKKAIDRQNPRLKLNYCVHFDLPLFSQLSTFNAGDVGVQKWIYTIPVYTVFGMNLKRNAPMHTIWNIFILITLMKPHMQAANHCLIMSDINELKTPPHPRPPEMIKVADFLHCWLRGFLSFYLHSARKLAAGLLVIVEVSCRLASSPIQAHLVLTWII